MKLKESFIIYNNGEDNIIMDSSAKFSGLAHVNATAASIVEFMKTETTKEEILKKMLEKYEVSDEAAVVKDIDFVIDQLKSIGAVEE